MDSMFSVIDIESNSLLNLGRRLRRRRLAAAEPQTRAASRIGVSVPTYRKLEQGDPSAPIGVWVRALRLYGDLAALDGLLPESLFDRDEPRQRAPRRGAAGASRRS
jgi:transcriptional regulator with XRE-family HTH domain